MATSETFNFNPDLSEIVLSAFSKAGVKRTAIVAQHMADARLEANFLLSEWSNLQPLLWTVELQSIDLVEGVSVYTIPPNVVFILDAYVRLLGDAPNSDPNDTDISILPLSRSEYARIPVKQLPGRPTSYWFDRTLAPTISIWPVPNASDTWTFGYYSVRQVQDANAPSGTKVEIPYRFLDAFVKGLAARLSMIYSLDRFQLLNGEYQRAWSIASTSDIEDTPIYLIPATAGYFR